LHSDPDDEFPSSVKTEVVAGDVALDANLTPKPDRFHAQARYTTHEYTVYTGYFWIKR